MPQYFPIDNVGEVGIVTDLLDIQLPPNAFSAGENVRFFENRAMAAKGYEDAFTPSVAPYFIDQVDDGTDIYYVYAGLDDIYTYDNASHVERTRAAGATVYTGSANDIWNGGVLHGYHVLTNGIDAPQSWQIGVGTDYENLKYDATTTWDDQSQECKIMVPFRDSLLAMDLIKSGSRLPRRVAWPEPAVPGSLPADWDPNDTTLRSGETDLVGGTGIIQCAKGMAESMIIYSEDLAWRCDWVGGAVQFDFNTLEWAKGAITRRAVAVLPGGQHFVVAAGDVYIHNGQNYQAIADERRKRAIFGDISETNYKQVFVIPNYDFNEVIVAVPLSGASFCTKAHVYNYRRNAWSERELPDVMAMVNALDPSADAAPTTWADWQTAGTTWDDLQTAGTPWEGEGYNPLNRSLLAASPAGAGAVYRMDSTNQADGTNINAYLQRTGLQIGNGDQVITITGMIPMITCCSQVDIRVGGQMLPGGPITWSNKVSFNPNTDQRCTFWGGGSGRYNAYEISSEGDVSWELKGLILEYQVRGGL